MPRRAAAQRAAGGGGRRRAAGRRRRADPGVDRAARWSRWSATARGWRDGRGRRRVRPARRRRGAARVRARRAVAPMTAQCTTTGTLTAEDLGRVHLIGVGGVGMSGLARLLLTRGIPVSGSELREWPALAGAAGARRHHPHAPRGVQPGRCRHGRLLHRHPGRPPGAGRGAARAGCGCCTAPRRWPRR